MGWVFKDLFKWFAELSGKVKKNYDYTLAQSPLSVVSVKVVQKLGYIKQIFWSREGLTIVRLKITFSF